MSPLIKHLKNADCCLIETGIALNMVNGRTDTEIMKRLALDRFQFETIYRPRLFSKLNVSNRGQLVVLLTPMVTQDWERI